MFWHCLEKVNDLYFVMWLRHVLSATGWEQHLWIIIWNDHPIIWNDGSFQCSYAIESNLVWAHLGGYALAHKLTACFPSLSQTAASHILTHFVFFVTEKAVFPLFIQKVALVSFTYASSSRKRELVVKKTHSDDDII